MLDRCSLRRLKKLRVRPSSPLQSCLLGYSRLFSITWSLHQWIAKFVACIKQGTNKGTLGEHELEIDDNGLVERTEVTETRQSWHGVERIVETDEHAFIYVSSMMAHVIPKHSVIAGDPNEFIARAKQLWLAANPNAEARQKA